VTAIGQLFTKSPEQFAAGDKFSFDLRSVTSTANLDL
jgi:hypothetical protein